MLCDDCSFAANPWEYGHTSRYFVQCTFLHRDKPIDSTCQVCSEGLNVHLELVKDQLDELFELRELDRAGDHGLFLEDRAAWRRLNWLEEKEEDLLTQPKWIARLRGQAQGIDARCPTCGYWRLDEEDTLCPRDGSELVVAR